MKGGDYTNKIKRLQDERRRVLRDIRSISSEKMRNRLLGHIRILDGIIARYEMKHKDWLLFRRYSLMACERDGNLSRFLEWYRSNGNTCLVKNNSTRRKNER